MRQHEAALKRKGTFGEGGGEDLILGISVRLIWSMIEAAQLLSLRGVEVGVWQLTDLLGLIPTVREALQRRVEDSYSRLSDD